MKNNMTPDFSTDFPDFNGLHGEYGCFLSNFYSHPVGEFPMIHNSFLIRLIRLICLRLFRFQLVRPSRCARLWFPFSSRVLRTSSYFEGDYEASEIVQFGHDRDHKNGHEQIVIGLMLLDGIGVAAGLWACACLARQER